MDHRSRSIWLPGLVTLALSVGLWRLLEEIGVHARILWLNNPPLIFSLSWVLALVGIGALGASISRRLGGSRRESLLAALFPSVAMAALFVLILPFALVIDSNVPRSLQFSGFASAILGWVMIPGAGLLAGGLLAAMARRHGPTPSVVQQ